MFVEIEAAITAGAAAWKNRNALKSIWRHILKLFRLRNLEIITFGAGGTGKTTLGHELAHGFNLTPASTAYKESLVVEKFDLPGDIVGTIIVAPGQERRNYTWTSLYQDLSLGKSKGIINVVSYGYHSFGETSYKEHKYYVQGMTEAEFLQSYLQKHREEELGIIEKLKPHIIAAKSKVWMITLVTKQDLWWNDRTTIENYYKNGKYNEHIQEIMKARGNINFTHEYLSMSLVISNFTTEKKEVLAQTTAGYDQNIQIANAQRVLEAILGFAKQ